MHKDCSCIHLTSFFAGRSMFMFFFYLVLDEIQKLLLGLGSSHPEVARLVLPDPVRLQLVGLAWATLTISSQIDLLRGYLSLQIHPYSAKSRLHLLLGSTKTDISQCQCSYSCHLWLPHSSQSTPQHSPALDYTGLPPSIPAEYSSQWITYQQSSPYFL